MKLEHSVTVTANIFHHYDERSLDRIQQTLNQIQMTQAEEATKLVGIKAQLTKVSAEVQAKIDALTTAIATAGATTPEVDAAVADLQTVADALDAIVPDEVPPTP